MSLKFLRLIWRKVLATAVAACLLAPAMVAAAEALPAAVRIAVVARTAPSGKTVFAGSAAQVAAQGWLAAELGKLGVKLEWVPVTTNSVATQVNEAFANRSIDLAQYGDLPSIIANASGLQTRLILPGGSANNTYLVVPNGSTAKSIKDLKGKKIALHRGRPWEYPFARLLEANGMTLRDVKILNLNPQAGAAAVATGGADAFFTLSDAFLLEDKKVGKIIWASKAPPQDWKMRAELWADSGFLQRWPQLAQLVVTAYVREHHRAAGAGGEDEYVRTEAAAGQVESVVRRELAGDHTPWQARWSPLFTASLRQHYVGEAAYAKSAGLIGRPLQVDSLFAPQFVNQALAQLKLQTFWSP
ncbi:ABC transporter substrate-binding protein [Janthinobacterium sp. EB271-G4-7A]|uniref:ABC transporter substrate-binding protein n=1 Tax=Janthinobacterium sp. EB271-G4-7A TaxID=2775056 RepID=UPI001E2C6B6D|nr:ABC transporter substrate-binding protein [Janthinobacterium sp. EB271-G4-7A]MCC7697227.1 ABC transporter substrate-binding protein [Janthinobacterium sp. EB271-G4-7A]